MATARTDRQTRVEAETKKGAETILVVAAYARELAGFAPRLEARAPLAPSQPLDYAEAGWLAGRRWILAANGAGPRLAALAARAFGPVDRMVSTGFCGGLDPALGAGDVVVCDRVIQAETNRRFRTADPHGATCLSGDRVIQTAREKQELRQTTGAGVVEMEAAGVAAEAEALGVPLHCIRVVTDTADEDMLVDFNAARDETGRFRVGRIVLSALGRPRTGIPELIKLNDRARSAAGKLGAYLVRHF